MAQAFTCPISEEIMSDPVIACDAGHTFEKANITHWKDAGQNSCPVCRGALRFPFIPNRSLREAITAAGPPVAATPAPAPAPLARSGFKDAPVSSVVDSFRDALGRQIVHVQVQAEDTPRQGSVYILGLDNSGSMEELADPQSNESLFTRMDLVYHTVNTVIEMLTEADRVAIVAFSTTARLVMPLTYMNGVGKASVKRVVSGIKPDAQTNIEAAVRMMMQIADRPELAGENIIGALLTDGEETVTSPSGTVPVLSAVRMTNHWNFSAFGLGYGINSSLLLKLAELGGGIFGFIPDVSMVGTVFINFVATAANTASRGTPISVRVDHTTQSIFTGVLSVGHPRDYFFPVHSGASATVSVGGAPPQAPSGTTSNLAKARKLFIDLLQPRLTSSADARNAMQSVKAALALLAGPEVAALSRDIQSTDPTEGQLGKAVQYWDRWGAHYARSYLRTVIERGCRLNFKDPGSLLHGRHPQFEATVRAGEMLFTSLDPPTPTGKKHSMSAQQVAHVQASTRTYLAQATSAAFSGGCFAGSSRVLMADGSRKPMSDVRPGDVVWTWTAKGAARVQVHVTCGLGPQHSQMMSKVGECILTPYHPFLDSNLEWVTGQETVGASMEPIDRVYNLVLDSGHVVDVEGVHCCTLAHGFEGPVIGHAFFGTSKVVEALKRCPGFPSPVYKNLGVHRGPDGLIDDWFEAEA